MSNGGPVQLPEITVKPEPVDPVQTQQAQGTNVTPGMAPPGTGTPGDISTMQLVYPTRPDGLNEPYDTARIAVAGFDPFDDWESVSVHLKLAESTPEFRFTAVERDTPGIWQRVQFVPGQRCQIFLGGVPVIGQGYIEMRQVAYDAVRHGVEISGKGTTAPIARSSVISDTGSFDNMSFLEVGQKVLSQFTTGIKVVGMLDPTPFIKLQNQPGEMVWDFLERLARVRKILLGTDPFGNFVFIGQHNGLVVNRELIEGQNIKRCQCVIHKDMTYFKYEVIGSGPGSDGQWGTSASQIKGYASGSGYLQSILITPAEQPLASQAEANMRAQAEMLWHEGPEIELTVTVQGWFRDPNNLWWPGDNVFVKSPMVPLNMLMKIQEVTFTQDNNSGTESTMLFKQPWALLDFPKYNLAPSTDPNAAPPVQTPSP